MPMNTARELAGSRISLPNRPGRFFHVILISVANNANGHCKRACAILNLLMFGQDDFGGANNASGNSEIGFHDPFYLFGQDDFWADNASGHPEIGFHDPYLYG
eukprot:1159724-Pelagomonas_calceolata.AAC.6